jgi:hypothetical protein
MFVGGILGYSFSMYENPLLFFLSVGLFAIGIQLQILADKNPIALLDVFGIGYSDVQDENVYYGSGWLKSIGLLGVKSWSGSLLGNLPGLKIPYEGATNYLIYPAMWGFCGIKIILDEDGCQKSFFGTALAVSIDNTP